LSKIDTLKVTMDYMKSLSDVLTYRIDDPLLLTRYGDCMLDKFAYSTPKVDLSKYTDTFSSSFIKFADNSKALNSVICRKSYSHENLPTIDSLNFGCGI